MVSEQEFLSVEFLAPSFPSLSVHLYEPYKSKSFFSCCSLVLKQNKFFEKEKNNLICVLN